MWWYFPACSSHIRYILHNSRYTDYGLDDRVIEVRFPGGGWEFFSLTPCPDRLWGPPSLLCKTYLWTRSCVLRVVTRGP
jgi:hypothetical protein